MRFTELNIVSRCSGNRNFNNRWCTIVFMCVVGLDQNFSKGVVRSYPNAAEWTLAVEKTEECLTNSKELGSNA